MNPQAAGRDARDEMPACGPDDLSVTVRWERDGTRLRGQVIAENTGERACRLPGKPGVRPLGPDGAPLPVETVITMELVSPGYVALEPGQRAAAPVSWGGWDGLAASSQARVTWEGGAVTAAVEGPTQPAATDAPRNISSSWFRPLS
jgi:hypothetical protein